LGRPINSNFLTVKEPTELQPSKLNQFPTEYKFISYNIHVASEQRTYQRQTYGLLEFFGDVGGLLDFFVSVGRFLFSPIARLKMFTLIGTGFYSW